jgi:hypothetical protein
MNEDELAQARRHIADAAAKGGAPMQRAVERAQHTPSQVDRILKIVKGSGDDQFDETGVAMIALRIIGYSYKKIGETLQVELAEVRRVLGEARRLSKLSDVGPLLENIALPQAVDNLIEKLEAGDLPATLATLRGRGAFRNFERSDNVDMQVQLSINIEQPPGVAPASQPSVIEGSVVGIPRRVGQSVLAEARNDEDDEPK